MVDQELRDLRQHSTEDTLRQLRVDLGEMLQTEKDPARRSILHRAGKALGNLAVTVDDLKSPRRETIPVSRSREMRRRANGIYDYANQFPSDSGQSHAAMIQFAVYVVGASILEQLEAINFKLEKRDAEREG